jgi:hypothetical protein
MGLRICKSRSKGVLFLKLVEAGDGGREEHFKRRRSSKFTMSCMP